MSRSYRQLIFLIILICLPTSTFANIYNGGFEEFEPHETLSFNIPLGWERENYTAVHDSFIPTPSYGNTDGWSIDLSIGLQPAEREFFLVLGSGTNSTNLSPDPWSASVWQYIYLFPEQTISGYYFFGTTDYLPFNDCGTIELVPYDSDELDAIQLARVCVSHVNPIEYNRIGTSMEGWEYFEYTIDANEEGAYYLTVMVEDDEDTKQESYFAVDGLTLCARPDYGDINHNCAVDFDDFALLALDWFKDCSDPNNCGTDTDLNNDESVDATDLKLMTDYWLYDSR